MNEICGNQERHHLKRKEAAKLIESRKTCVIMPDKYL